MSEPSKLFATIPAGLPKELVEPLLISGSLRIERIVWCVIGRDRLAGLRLQFAVTRAVVAATIQPAAVIEKLLRLTEQMEHTELNRDHADPLLKLQSQFLDRFGRKSARRAVPARRRRHKTPTTSARRMAGYVADLTYLVQPEAHP